MNIFVSSSFQKTYKKIIKKNPQLKIKIKERIKTFIENPTNTSLKTHKLQGGLHRNYSFSVKSDLRILFTYVDNDVIFVDIGKHEEVY